jgi:large subunit ribosomal protein L34e
MPAPGQKTKKKKKRKTAKRTKQYFARGKTAKQSCALCGRQLHGVPHGQKVAEIAKMSKTEKRPSARFGGILCGKCRREVAEEKAMVENGLKELGSVNLKVRRFLAVKGAAQ